MTYGTGDTIIDSTYSSRPLMFEDALGYRSDAQWVAFYRTPAGDELRYDDGTMSAEGSWFVWHLFVHHPRIAPALQPYQCGSSNEEPPHWLLLNRVARTLSVGMTADVKHFLSQGASPALTADTQTALPTTISTTGLLL